MGPNICWPHARPAWNIVDIIPEYRRFQSNKFFCKSAKNGPFSILSVKFISNLIKKLYIFTGKVANTSNWPHTMRAVLEKWAPADQPKMG
jgi:hypothetical protein